MASGRLLFLHRSRVQRNQTLLQGEQHQVCIALQVERFHDVMLVELDRFLTQIEMTGDFFGGTPFRVQLDNVALRGVNSFEYWRARAFLATQSSVLSLGVT